MSISKPYWRSRFWMYAAAARTHKQIDGAKTSLCPVQLRFSEREFRPNMYSVLLVGISPWRLSVRNFRLAFNMEPKTRLTSKRAVVRLAGAHCRKRLVCRGTVVLRYRIHLEQKRYAPSTINLRLAAVRRVAYQPADSGLLSPELAAGIRRSKEFVVWVSEWVIGLLPSKASVCLRARTG
jgi:hypothetical protein